MQFLALGLEVMAQRERDGVRGRDREWSRWRCHIAPSELAQMNVEEIRPRHVRAWLRGLAQKEAKGSGPKRRLSRATVNRSLSLVSAVCVEALERDIIEMNPCLGVKSRKRVDESDTRDKWAFLTVDEQRLLFACEEIPREHRLMMRVSIGTGMRQGEFRHLELSDFVVDGEDPHVLIRVAGRDKKTGAKLPPKSGKKRKVQLFEDALEAVREWLAMLPAYAPDNRHNLVFPTPSGGHWQQGKIFGHSSSVRRYYALAGIQLRPHLHWHAQRHTFASNLVRRGVPLPVIQKLMGHSSVTITERYAHLGEDAVANTIRALEAPEVIEVPAIDEVVDVAPSSAAIVVRAPEPAPHVEERSVIKSIVGRLFGRSKEVSHVV